MKKAVYVWKSEYPWDVRAEKVCSSLLGAGFETYILARWTGGQAREEEINGLKIIRAGYGKNGKFMVPLSINPVWIREIREIIRKVKPDIIIPRDIMIAEACAKEGHKKGVPVAMDMAENYPAAMKDWKKYRRSALTNLLVHKLDLPELVEKRAVNLMDGIFTVCEEQSERLNKVYNFPLERTAVVHNTPRLNAFTEARKGCSQPPKIFGHHGFTSAEKSVYKFLQGFIKASETNKDIEFILAGEGESYEDYVKLLEESGASGRVKMTGAYEFKNLPKIIGEFDIGVIPYQVSDFNDYTIHNKLFDFFAAGKPVFLSATKPFKRIIDETGAGVIADCESANSISKAIIDFVENADVKAMSERAYEAHVNKYNWEIDEKKLVEFLDEFVP